MKNGSHFVYKYDAMIRYIFCIKRIDSERWLVLHSTSWGYVKVEANIFETEEARATSLAWSLSVVVLSIIIIGRAILMSLIVEKNHK